MEEIAQSKKWVILIITSVSTFMATLDSSIVNIALPTMSKILNTSISSIQWVVTSYLLTISLLLLVWGKLSDLFGKKVIFSSGFLVFALGSLMCGLSHTLSVLVLSRILQAIGASAMMSLSQGIVTGTFRPEERGRALGFVGMTVALGSLTGPSLGGVLVHAFGWQSIFYINIPIGIIGAVLAFIVIPELFETQTVKYFDIAGTVTFSLAVLVLFLSLLLAQEGAIPFIFLIPAILVSAVLLVSFILIERKSKNPLLELGLFKRYEFSMGLAAAYLGFITINSALLFIPFYLEDYLGMSPLTAGLIISVYPITTALVSPVSGWLSDKISYGPLTVAGMLISTVSFVLFATVHAGTPHLEIIALLILLGAGIATFQSPNNSSVMGSVPRQQLGVAGGANALFRNLGFVSGTAFSVLIFTFSTKLNINSLSSGTGGSLFLKGFSIIMLFNAACDFAVVVLSAVRLFSLKRMRDSAGS